MRSTFFRLSGFGGLATLLFGVAALTSPASGVATASTSRTGSAGVAAGGGVQEPYDLGFAPPGSVAQSIATRGCPRVGHRQASRNRLYVNPLRHTKVTAERIDQGVDYAGTGALTAIGAGKVVYVGTTRDSTGWPGAFIEYRINGGNFAGRYVYYAEGVRPASGIRVGRHVRAGQDVVHLIRGWSTGIEIGWAADIGTETLARALGEYRYPTRCGQSFSNFVQSLGGPPGIR